MQLPKLQPNDNQSDVENIPPAATIKKKGSSHKRGAVFIGLGRDSKPQDQKRKHEDEERDRLELSRSVKPRRTHGLSYEYDRPVNPIPVYRGPGSLYDLLMSRVGDSQDDAIVIPASPEESEGIHDFFEVPLPYIPELPPSPLPTQLSPAPALLPAITAAQRRQKLYEFGRAPQSLPRKRTQPTSAATRKNTNIINPFLPRYHKANGKHVKIASDSSDIENPNSTRNVKRRKFYRAVILQQMMFHQLFPPVQAELMRRPMKSVIKEFTEIQERRIYIQAYVLPHIRGRSFRPVLNHIIAVRGQLPHHFQAEPVEGPSTFWFLLYTSFAEWDRQRIH